MLARALYRCGDHDGVGEKILRDYTQDLRGHLARATRKPCSKNGRTSEGAASEDRSRGGRGGGGGTERRRRREAT